MRFWPGAVGDRLESKRGASRGTNDGTDAKQPLTLETFLEQPETKPASEYINGEIVQKPVPQGKHSVLQRELSFALTAALRPERIAQGFPELRCTFGGRSLVPDLAVFRTQRIPRDRDGSIANVFTRHPDWMIEILSLDQSHTKVIRNILHCLNSGTVMGWLLDPAEACILVYVANRAVRIFEGKEATLPVPDFAAAVELTAGEIFIGLQG